MWTMFAKIAKPAGSLRSRLLRHDLWSRRRNLDLRKCSLPIRKFVSFHTGLKWSFQVNGAACAKRRDSEVEGADGRGVCTRIACQQSYLARHARQFAARVIHHYKARCRLFVFGYQTD